MSVLKTNYNPDVLSCLANLSNDEVFTPPSLVNDILDTLPKELWKDKNATFLDPVSKSGVFLREIAKRLMEGLEEEIPDKQERINHIFSNQIFGISITELTALLSRRSVYCSKDSNSKYSVCDSFEGEQGNIMFNRIQHTWKSSKCAYCGASQEVYERSEELETHAYEFIHTDEPDKLFNMKFDVIVGNPPYQLSDEGHGTSAKPIYQKFVQQAKKLNPRFLTMIIPARWYAGGKGLSEFREEMLNDKRICRLVDYFDSAECFPGVDISGGICYFLWEKEHEGNCEVTSMQKEKRLCMTRPLLEEGNSTFIRFNEAVNIVRKVQVFKEAKLIDQISSRKPFGFGTSFESKTDEFKEAVKIYSYPRNGWVKRDEIAINPDWVDKYKVYISKAYGERGAFPYRVLAKPFLGDKNSCCSETYLVVGPYTSKKQAENAAAYINTRFFRFLVLLMKNTQDSSKSVYSYVPAQDFNEKWTDEKLYKKYGITNDEVAFIDSMIRPMG